MTSFTSARSTTEQPTLDTRCSDCSCSTGPSTSSAAPKTTPTLYSTSEHLKRSGSPSSDDHTKFEYFCDSKPSFFSRRFYELTSILNSVTVPKKIKGETLWFFLNTHSVAKLKDIWCNPKLFESRKNSSEKHQDP